MPPISSPPELPHIEYEGRYLAFIDVLGFSNIISKSAKEPAVVSYVHEALTGITRRAQSARSRVLGIQATSFSDNVVVSLPVSGTGLFHLLALIHKFSQKLLSLGMLFRGAVVRGSALHTEELVFGPALVDAYRLETTTSLHPRVMLSDQVLKDAESYVAKSRGREPVLQRLVRQDPHDVPYINLFADWADDDEAWKPETIAKLNLLRSMIERGQRENAKNPNVAEKIPLDGSTSR